MMTMIPPPGPDTIRALSRSECLALMRAESTGRAAFTSDGLLTIVPVPFSLERGKIVIGWDRPQLVERAVGQVVTLQCDGFDEPSCEQWSVCATGFVARDPSGGLFMEPRLFSGWAERRYPSLTGQSPGAEAARAS